MLSQSSLLPRKLVLRFVAANFMARPRMRHCVFFLIVIVSLSATVFGEKPAWQPPPGHTTLPVWPQAALGAPPNPAPEVDTTTAQDNQIAGKPLVRLGNVSAPTLTVYAPTGKNTG